MHPTLPLAALGLAGALLAAAPAHAVDEPNLNNDVAAPGLRLPHTVQDHRHPGYPGQRPGVQRPYPPPHRGAGPEHSFYRGGRLPPMYRDRRYVVDDWRAHRLSRPPRGYQWVQTGGDYVLASRSSGVILQVMLAP